MLIEKVKVLSITQACVWVERLSSKTCVSCSASCAHQGQSEELVPRLKNSKLKLPLPSSMRAADFSQGDLVDMEISEHAVLALSFIFYLLPLGTMLVTMLGVSALGYNEIVVIVSTFFGFFIGMILLRLIGSYYSFNSDLQPKLVPLSNHYLGSSK